MTTNDLETKLARIKANPRGKVARDASHWLAVNVMGWGVESYQRFDYTIGDCYVEPKTEEGVGIDVDEWQPFTDANHTFMLEKKMGFNLFLITDRTIEEAIYGYIESCFERFYRQGTLTNDEIKQWGGNEQCI